jgi:hypothetical protein
MKTQLNNFVHPVDDDIRFWMGQFKEHAIFLHNLLNPETVPNLKQEALSLASALNRQILTFPNDPGLELLISLYALLEELSNKTEEIPNINVDICVNDFRDVVHHMILEQTYYTRLMEGKMTIGNELLFWLQEGEQHLGLTSHLLDCCKLKDQAAELSNQLKQMRFKALSQPCNLSTEVELLMAANKFATEVDNAIVSGTIKTIDRNMHEHEIRETEYGRMRVNSLLTNLAL